MRGRVRFYLPFDSCAVPVFPSEANRRSFRLSTGVCRIDACLASNHPFKGPGQAYGSSITSGGCGGPPPALERPPRPRKGHR